MTKKSSTILAIALLILVTGQVFAKEITVQGKLQKTVEPGGWLIVATGQKYLVLNADRFNREKWFGENTEVEAVGEVKPDVVTTYMEGTPFEARTMHPVSQHESTVTAGESRLLTRIRVEGDATVQATPDTATITVSVVTQNKRALDAQQENAMKTDAVIHALKNAAGAGAEIKTSGYSLQPQRVYRENQPPTITGYEARNSVTISTSELTKVGMLIDATAQAGANDVAGISFVLRKDRPARDQALAEATHEATQKAQVIAQALGGRVVRILEVQEEGSQIPRPLYQAEMGAMRTMAASAPPTPVEIGTLDIVSRVQLIAEIDGG